MGGSRKGPLKKPCSILGSVCLKSHHSSCSFSVSLSRAPNGNRRGAGDSVNIGGVPAVEELTLMLSVAQGHICPQTWPAGCCSVQLPGHCSQVVWPSLDQRDQGPGVEGVGTSSRERSSTRTAPETGHGPQQMTRPACSSGLARGPSLLRNRALPVLSTVLPSLCSL